MQNSQTHSSERRPVSVLFTDMVGFTTIVERLGEDRALAFSKTIYKLLTEAVKAHGGTVHDFAGDSVMAVFGIPAALEDAALRACRAAAAVHSAFDAAGPEIEAQFGLRPKMRVGISSGIAAVALADGTGSQMLAVGSTVNLASRVQALARPGSSLICDATRAQVEWLVDLGFDGEHPIKGLSKPQKLWELRALREGATRFDVSVARGLSPLFGREAELEQLSDNLTRSKGGLRVVDVVAEPGQGKTRLIFEFLRRDEVKGVTVLSGNCSADGRQTAFLPFIEVLRQSFRIRNEDEPAEISRRIEAGLRVAGLHSIENLGLLLNLLGLAPPEGALKGLDGVLIGLRTRDLLPSLLRAQCQAGPVILLVEDVHWIDTASEGLLRTLVENADQTNLMILTLRRPEYLPDWLNRSDVTTLALAPLTGDDIRQLVQSRLGIAAPPDDLIRQITDRAGGNPLFGEEILIFLLQQGALSVTNGRAEFDPNLSQSDLPASMQSLMTARMDRLPRQDRNLLQAAAAIGRRFDPGLLATVSAKPDETGAILQRLQDQDIVRHGLSGAFV
jgi:class 3 adenylate cyclase